VLDTQGPQLYIGVLASYDERGYWLVDADVHDRGDGHSGKELYINDAHLLHKAGTRTVNRRRVFVDRAAVVSISALDDVVAGGPPPPAEDWAP
jgi:hypothetical protein